MIVPTLFWAKLVELGPDSTSNPTVGLKALLQYKPYNKLLVLQDDVKSLLITVNITARHWFLLQVDVVNAKIIVYDSIFQDEAFYDSYFKEGSKLTASMETWELASWEDLLRFCHPDKALGSQDSFAEWWQGMNAILL